jgi:hypothetical protein
MKTPASRLLALPAPTRTDVPSHSKPNAAIRLPIVMSTLPLFNFTPARYPGVTSFNGCWPHELEDGQLWSTYWLSLR